MSTIDQWNDAEKFKTEAGTSNKAKCAYIAWKKENERDKLAKDIYEGWENKNPNLKVSILKRMMKLEMLWIKDSRYKTGIANDGRIYYIAVNTTGYYDNPEIFDIGEYHLHWDHEAKQPKAAGWKKGKNGNKILDQEKAQWLLGNLWMGKKNTGNSYKAVTSNGGVQK